MPAVTVTRRLTFNAAHRVHNPALSDEENTRLFGKCNNPNWHGHNYVLEVSVTGEPDPRTGYVVDLGEVKRIVEAEFVSHVDHANPLPLGRHHDRGDVPPGQREERAHLVSDECRGEALTTGGGRRMRHEVVGVELRGTDSP